MRFPDCAGQQQGTAGNTGAQSPQSGMTHTPTPLTALATGLRRHAGPDRHRDRRAARSIENAMTLSRLAGPQYSGMLVRLKLLSDAARKRGGTSTQGMEVPPWSGLHLHALAQTPGQNPPGAQKNPQAKSASTQPGGSLRDVETALIQQAVDDARGNVMQAALALGISRATVYRRQGTGKRG